MTSPDFKQRALLEHCLMQMSHKVPRLREALTQRDDEAVRDLARDLRHTVGLLGLPRLYQLSQDIERHRDAEAHTDWHQQCYRFCDLLERIYSSMQLQMDKN